MKGKTTMQRPLLNTGLATLLASLTLTVSTHATIITYNLTGTPPAPQTYDYTVFNNSIGVPLEEFIVYFPDVVSPDNFGYALLSATAPAGWQVSLIPASAINLGALGDAFALSGSEIPVGGSLGGFQIDFTYNGPGRPGSQFFEVYDSSFNLLDSGYTVPGVSPIPEPSSMLGGALAFGLLLGLVRRRMSARRAR